jgi:hypothetical protein
MAASILARALGFALPLLAGLAALERAVEYGRAHAYVHQAGKINLAMQHRVSPEIAVFGASNALVDFDAPLLERLLGETTYDYGIDGTPFVQYQALIRDFAASSPRGGEVVLAETFMTFVGLDGIRNPDMWLPHVGAPAVYEVLHRIDPELAWKARYVPFYPLIEADQDSYKAALRGYLSLLGRPPPDSQVQGYLAKDETWRPPAPGVASTVAEYPFDERVVPQFAEVIALLNRAGKRVTVVVTPIEEDCLAALPYLDAHRDRLRSLVGAGEGNVFLDYTHHPIARDKAGFYNCGHLNRSGAAAFTRIFAADLAALPPARGRR